MSEGFFKVPTWLVVFAKVALHDSPILSFPNRLARPGRLTIADVTAAAAAATPAAPVPALTPLPRPNPFWTGAKFPSPTPDQSHSSCAVDTSADSATLRGNEQ